MITCARAGVEAINHVRDALGEDQIIVTGADTVDLSGAIDSLAARGLPRVLCEGGPHVLRDLTVSGRLDELCLTIAPTLVAGEHSRITAGGTVSSELFPRLLLESQGAILGSWTRR
jgi:riboflavin biosynthesis pyrimidine reductase